MLAVAQLTMLRDMSFILNEDTNADSRISNGALLSRTESLGEQGLFVRVGGVNCTPPISQSNYKALMYRLGRCS